METRPYGSTREHFPILSFGAQRIIDDEGCSEKVALAVMNYALDHGIRYFDTAQLYGEGQSEERVGKVARNRRREMWIATKTLERGRKEARKELEVSLRRLQTDYLDEWRMHYIYDLGELDSITAPGGALEAAMAAKKQGLVRFISISGHSNPQVQVEALNRFPFDSVLCATSVLDHFVVSFAEEFLPVARAKKVAVAGMKILGAGRLVDIYARALRYAFSLPIDTAVVGMNTIEQVKANLAVAEGFTPMTPDERLDLFKEILPRVSPANAPWKAEDWDNPVEWKRR
jgi:uncharacterized protein